MKLIRHSTCLPRPMTRALCTLAISGALALTVFASPAHAAVIDQVKNRVDAIKSDTNTLKQRTAGISAKADELIQRAEETAMTVNAVIAETDRIKAGLLPLAGIDDVFDNVRDVQGRFAQLQFQPLDVLDNPHLQYLVDELKRRSAEAQERLNDPDIEPFRAELLTLLEEIRQLISERAAFDVEGAAPEPFQRLVGNAPPVVIALFKTAMESELQPIRDALAELASVTSNLGPMLEDPLLGDSDGASRSAARGAPRQPRRFDVCAPYSNDPETFWVLALRGQQASLFLNRRLSKIAAKVPDSGATELGIHGYASVQVDISKEGKEKLEDIAGFFEYRNEKFELMRDVVEHCMER